MSLVVCSAFCCLLSILFLSRIAPYLGLVDVPDNRKYHKGRVPLIGGLAILVSLAMTVVVIDAG